MSSQFKRVLLIIFAIALPIAAAPHLMTRFGTPPFINSVIQADHQRKLAASGGVWCFQFNPNGSARDIFYGAAESLLHLLDGKAISYLKRCQMGSIEWVRPPLDLVIEP